MSKCKSAVWALAVVVLDVDPENVFEVAPAENQQPVEWVYVGTPLSPKSPR